MTKSQTTAASLPPVVEAVLARWRPFEGDERRQDQAWAQLRDEVFAQPGVAFEHQWRAFQEIFAGRPKQAPPPAVWSPRRPEATNIGALMAARKATSFEELHRWSVGSRADFWSTAIDRLGIRFSTPAKTILDQSGGAEHARWLSGARLNIVDSCFQAPASQAAIRWAREDGRVRTMTYAELEARVNQVADGAIKSGLAPQDAVALYMPMTPDCVAAYLGLVKAGLVVVSIPDSFAPPEIASRLRIAQAKAMITVEAFARGGQRVDMYAKAKAAKAPRCIVIPLETAAPPLLRQGDVLWSSFLGESRQQPSHVTAPDATTNILFSSGTTGEPKGIPWTHLTPIKAAVDGHFHQDIHPEDVVAWPTNIGWMMGPWLIYASLINRATMALYEGSPTSEGFLKFVEEADVSVLGLVPSIVRRWRETRAAQDVRWPRLRLFSSTGESSAPEDYLWLMHLAQYRAPVIEYCGGTEVGGGHLTGTLVQPACPATFSTPALGIDVEILDGDGRPVPEGGLGELFLVPPSIGLSQRLVNKDHHEVYYEGCPAGQGGRVLRRHGDEVTRLPGGHFQAHGRADDTMNLEGIKVSSIEIERTLNGHAAVFETAAVAITPNQGGADRLVVFCVLRQPMEAGALKTELQTRIKKDLNPLFRIHDLVIVEALPRTASNKVMRRELRAQYKGAAREAG